MVAARTGLMTLSSRNKALVPRESPSQYCGLCRSRSGSPTVFFTFIFVCFEGDIYIYVTVQSFIKPNSG